MQVPDHVGTTGVQQLVASLEGWAAEVVGSETDGLEVRPSGPVEDDETRADLVEIVSHGRHHMGLPS